MIYQFEGFRLDVKARTLISPTGEQPVRPKTLALLVYLIEHRAEIISKEQLLSVIWDDVNVNEGVIFQSIREIRKLFGDAGVIQNHPRKGYQWVGRVTLIEDAPCQPLVVQMSPKTGVSRVARMRLPLAVVAATLLMVGFLWVVLIPATSQPALVLLPLQSQMDNNDRKGLETRGTRKLYKLLADNSPGLLTSVARNDGLIAGDKAENPWLLSAAVYGEVYDYKLVYHLTNNQHKYQGVIFAQSVERALQILADATLLNVQQRQTELKNLQPELYQNPELAQAMVAYETDWETATQYLQNYLQQQEPSVKAIEHLGRLYIWQGNHEQAVQLTRASLEDNALSNQDRVELMYNLALAFWHQQPERALSMIQEGMALTGAPESWLTRAKLEELAADIHYQNNQPVQALRGYLRAQSFYDEIQASVNVAGLKLKLAALYIGNKDVQMARKTFLQAKDLIQDKEMSFLYAALMEFEQQHLRVLD